MKRTIGAVLTSLTLMMGVLVGPVAVQVSAAVPQHVAAISDAKANVCSGAALAGSSCSDKGAPLNTSIAGIIKLLSVLVGIVAVFMIIFAGFKYITSGGDTNGVASAKHTLIYAIVGLVVVALAQLIVHFVLNNA